MKINGTDSSLFQAKQLKYEIGHREINAQNEWPAGSEIPVMGVTRKGFKTVKVYMAVYGKGKEAVMQNRSNLIAAAADEVKLELDNYQNHFICILKSTDIKETMPRKYHEVTMKFEGYEQGEEISTPMNALTAMVLNVKGNDTTPCIVEITPTFALSSLSISGLSQSVYGTPENVTIKNLTPGKTVIIDGETGTVTQDGKNKFSEVDMWEFPFLHPGKNTISCTSDKCNITIKYKPRYM